MCVIVLFVFLTIANAQSERENKALMNSHLSQNSQPFQQSRDTDGSIVISGNQQFIIHRHNRTATACNPGDIAPTGNDCIAYYECIDGYYKLRFCPSNTFFDPALKRCHASYVCPKRSYELRTSSLPPCKHGELRGDERSCKNYDASTDHRFQRRNCPDGTIFDRTLNRCVSNAAGSNCQQSIIQRDLEWKNIAIGLACRESSGASGYNADPTDRRRYYQCAQGRWIRMQCPGNLVWNPAATVCDWPENTLPSPSCL